MTCQTVLFLVLAMPLACKRTPLSHAQLAQLPGETLVQKHRTLLLQGEIDQRKALQVSQQLLHLQRLDASAPVTLLIDASGSTVAAARSIRGTMDSLQVPVHTHCLRAADGMALFLLAHGARGHRTAAASAQLALAPLIFPKRPAAARPAAVARAPGHTQFAGGSDGLLAWTKDGQIAQAAPPGGGVPDNPVDRPVGLDSDSPSPAAAVDDGEPDENTHARLVMYEELAADTGQDAAQIGQDVAGSRRFSASEALSYGLIDRIEE
jgi:ATP-dependent protease ClpP protease subunit